jgi:hypothetical protein
MSDNPTQPYEIENMMQYLFVRYDVFLVFWRSYALLCYHFFKRVIVVFSAANDS